MSIQCAGELGRQCHQVDLVAAGGNRVDKILRRVGDGPSVRRGIDVTGPGCRQRRRRAPKAVTRLGAAELGIDEIALEVRAEHTRGASVGSGARRTDIGKDTRQLRRAAGNSRRTERGHAVSRQNFGDAGDWIVVIEGVEAIRPVDVDVDEPGNDDMTGQIDDIVADRRRPAGTDVGDPIARQHDGGNRHETAVADHGRTRQQRHASGEGGQPGWA